MTTQTPELLFNLIMFHARRLAERNHRPMYPKYFIEKLEDLRVEILRDFERGKYAVTE